MVSFLNKRALPALAGCAMAALLAAGCSHQDNTPPAQVNTTTNVTPPAVAPGAATTTVVPGPTNTVTKTTGMPSTNNTNAGAGGATGSQTAVADAVNKAIHNNAQMTGSRVTAVVSASGAARLTGTAQNPQQKGLAESTARQTAGVSSVINKIEIVPTGGMKSAAKPAGAAKTKVIVVHDGAPAPTDQPAPSGPTASGSADTGAGDGGTPAPTTTDSTTPPASSTDTKSQ